MIDSLENVNFNFFKLFAGETLKDPIQLTTHLGDSFDVKVMYFKESSIDYTSTSKETYPVISIQEYLPEFNDDWHNDPTNVVKRYSALKDLDSDGLFDTVSWIKDPFYMTYRFDVSTATKDYHQNKAMINYMFVKYGNKGSLSFNSVDNFDLADFVDYTVNSTDIERSDGVMETNYEFTIKCWVHITEVVEYEDRLLQVINTTL